MGLVTLFFYYYFNFLILITLFYFIYLFIYFSSEPNGWQGHVAPTWCQAWASEVGELSSGYWTTRDLPAPRNINQQELSQWSPSQCYDSAPLNDQKLSAGHPMQTTSNTGTQTYPLAERLPNIILSSQTSQNTPLDVVLPTRKTRSSLIHQKTSTSPLHQEA